MAIETFYETKYFVVVEHGTHSDHRLRLTYYDYNSIGPDSKPICEYQSKENEWTYECPVKRINNHSKLAWWKQKHDTEIFFYIFDLKEGAEGKLTEVRVNNTLGQAYNIANMQVSIATLWETIPDNYMLVTNTNKI